MSVTLDAFKLYIFQKIYLEEYKLLEKYLF